ncbi:sulfotransferase [Thiohalobacter sp. COW1]|nr:sulfotransferase [Thiohalobacter sp. COW1]
MPFVVQPGPIPTVTSPLPASPPRPNLFLIGAMKSGTTSLHALLAMHPQVFMCEPKEPCYFLDPDQLRRYWPEMWERRYWESEAAYLKLFAAAGDVPVIGESSTDYSKLPRFAGVVERIRAFNPQARFIYIMRDPVERTLSHYWHMVTHRAERRDMLMALREEPHYLEVSHYARQLRPYLDAFTGERILTLTFEALQSDPLTTVQQVFAWLGVDPDFVPPDPAKRENVTAERVQQVSGRGLLHRLRHSRLWDRVGPWVPAGVRRLGVRLSQKEVDRADVDRRAAVDYLRPIQREQTEELRRLLGCDFPEWKTLYG